MTKKTQVWKDFEKPSNLYLLTKMQDQAYLNHSEQITPHYLPSHNMQLS